MPINETHEDLPKAQTSRRGTRYPKSPTERPLFVQLLAEEWQRRQEDKFALPAIPEAGPYRASMASTRCSRALAYSLAGVEQSDKPTIADLWRMGLGQMVHDAQEAVVKELFPDALHDAPFDMRESCGIPGSGRADLIADIGIPKDDGDYFTSTPEDSPHDNIATKRVAVEYKTVNGFKFKMQTTDFKKEPEGPAYGAIVQGALAAKHFEADALIVGSFSMECLSPSMAQSFTDSEIGRFAAEWHFGPKVVEHLVTAEAARVHSVLAESAAVGPGAVEPVLMDPDYIGRPVVVNPANKGQWVSRDEAGDVVATGTTWMCDYCRYKSRCIVDGVGQ